MTVFLRDKHCLKTLKYNNTYVIVIWYKPKCVYMLTFKFPTAVRNNLSSIKSCFLISTALNCGTFLYNFANWGMFCNKTDMIALITRPLNTHISNHVFKSSYVYILKYTIERPLEDYTFIWI